MHFHLNYRIGWWAKRMSPHAKPELKAQLEPIWFAGDPRFFGVIAVTRPGSDAAGPAPKHLRFLAQIGTEKKNAAIDVNPWQASSEDHDRARQVVEKGALRRHPQ